MTAASILVVDDEPGLREFLVDALTAEGHAVAEAASAETALRHLATHAVDLMLTDLSMPGQGGMALVRAVRRDHAGTAVMVLTAHGTVDAAVEAMRLGAVDFLQKPVASPEALAARVARALGRRAGAATRPAGTPRLGYGDPAMAPVEQAVARVAPTGATVLLLGESGTGKEVCAQAIHAASPRASGPFVAVNCAALSPQLLESELFGHEKGAFTGATERHVGRLAAAAGGTFFLDEIGELAPALQAKLLRVLQEKRFEPVGSTRSQDADVRWIAATHRDLPAMIAAGTFREDLYHRLAVFPIALPPLRARPADVVPLARALLVDLAVELGHAITLTPAAEAALTTGTWPGNVRELRNALARAAILADDGAIDVRHLTIPTAPAATAMPGLAAGSLDLADLERAAVEAALRQVGGNRRRAAELLGIAERTLYDKLKRYGLA